VYSLVLKPYYWLLNSAGDTSLKVVKDAFDSAKIPEHAYLNFEPITLLQVTFPQSESSPVLVSAGDQLERNQTGIPPLFGLRHAYSLSASGKFVLAIVDLDPPTPQEPTKAQVRHYLGGNFEVAGKSDAAGVALLSNSTPALTEFRQPTPPAGSDPHRYVFLLYKQPEGFNDQTEVNSTTPAQNFNVSQFALDVGLGDPLGGTFILVGPEADAEL